MLNKVNLMGRLTKDPEYRMTQSGTAVTSFSLAVERDYQSDGERQADFINCVAFKGAAEFINRYFVKGQLVCACGRLQSRIWEGQDGKKNYAMDVIVNEVHFTGDKRNIENASVENASTEVQPSDDFIHVPDDNLPF